MEPTVGNFGGAPKSGKKFRKYMIAGVAALGVALLGVATFSAISKSGTDKQSVVVARQFLELVQKGDFATTYDTHANETFKQATTRQQWAASVSGISPFLNGDISQSGDPVVDGTAEGAVTTYKFITGESQYEVTIEVVEEGGIQKVKFFESRRMDQG